MYSDAVAFPTGTQDKGQVAQLKVELRAAELGMVVSRPTTQARYDMIIDDGTKLFRVQVKYCDSLETKSAGGAYHVSLMKGKNDEQRKPYSSKEVDAIVVYLPSEEALAWLTPRIFDEKAAVVLRVSPPMNNQKKGVHLLNDFRW